VAETSIEHRLLEEGLAYAAVFYASAEDDARTNARQWIVETLTLLGRTEAADRFAKEDRR
jgi:hypothetical protein